jgi:SNF2 family DNA or RNA helicase
MATRDELEDDILFQNVLIESLDMGADDYEEKLAAFEATKKDLERQTAALNTSGPPAGLDGSSDPPQANTPTHPGHNTYTPYLNNAGSAQHTSNQANIDVNAITNSMKRPRPHSAFLDQNEHPSKRPTPEHSSGSTPTSSSSFELVEHPNRSMADRARDRHLAYEATMRRRRAEEQRDAEYARILSQTPTHNPSPFAGPSSSQRPGIQTTIRHNGTYAKPPPMPHPAANDAVQSLSQQVRPARSFSSPMGETPGMPNVKPEPSSSHPVKREPRHSLHLPDSNSRGRAPVVDLTGDDSDDEPAEIPPSRYTPSKRSMPPIQTTKSLYPQVQQPANAYPSYQSMPGAYPGFSMTYNGQQVNPFSNQPGFPTVSVYNGNQQVYPSPNPRAQQQKSNAQNYSFPPRPVAAPSPRAPYGAHPVPRGAGGPMEELHRLIPGSSSRPFPLYDDDDDDDEPMFTGSRVLNSYRGHEDMYRRRFDQIQEHDPAKTAEEINDLLNNIRPDEDIPDHLLVPTPEAMAVRLHQYQEMGLTWLKKAEEGTNNGGILADDMGLGKTIQMLSLIVTRKSEDPRCKTTLIVAPVALLRQWKQEIQQKVKTGRHALTVFIHHGATKKRSFRDLQHYDIVITTFGSLASEVKKMEAFLLRKKHDPGARPNQAERCALIDPDALWYRVILDEAQCIKNKSTQTAKGACMVNAKYRFCMTGTPMMNNIGELYSLIHFLRVKPYCVWDAFRSNFVTPLKGQMEEERQTAMRRLQVLCKGIMLRRTKKSMYRGKPILVLPERTTEVQHAAFNTDEDELYKALESKTAVQFNKYLKAGTVGRSYTAILVLLLRLRQACCHPHLIKDFSVSEAAGVAIEDMVKLAEELAPPVVARIKETNGNFECPICMDGCTNPAIFLPCGHDTCRDCFVTLSDPTSQLAQGNENGTQIRCPECRGNIDTKRITDFNSFKKVHMRELLTKEELEEMEADGSDTLSGESDSDTDSDTDEDNNEDQTLDGFVVADDAAIEHDDSSTESEAVETEPKSEVKSKSKSKGKSTVKEEADDDDDEGGDVVGPSRPKSKSGKQDKKPKKGKKSKKAKGKQNQLSLADLKKLSTRNAGAKKKYLHKLRKTFVSSAKIDSMMEFLEDIIETADDGEKVLIFSQWTSLLDLAEVPIEGKGWGYRRYDGSMNAKMRGDAVDDFKDARKNVRIMLVSLKAGNAGLNLNVANRVIILDPFWNPYVEEQAIDRAHRIGQVRPVKVHRVLIPSTVEDRIIELQEKKRALIEEALDEKQHQSISRLGVQELAYLFGVTRNANERVQYQERRRER